MSKAKALNDFWNSFFISAYEENTQLEKIDPPVKFPYITYQRVIDSFGSEIALTASIWDKDRDGYSADLQNYKKAEEISKCIGHGGVFVPFEGGSLWVKRGSPFAQPMADTDRSIKRTVLNISVEYITAD